MEIIIHELDGERVAEVVSDSVVIGNVQEALDLMVDPGLKGARKIIVHKENIIPGFFDLRTLPQIMSSDWLSDLLQILFLRPSEI